MNTARAANAIPSAPESQPKAVLVVSLASFDVLHASPLAIAWLDYPIDRLLGRSLMLSVPPLGQALTLAAAHGLSELPTPLGVSMVNSDGARLMVYAHRVDADAIIDFEIAEAQDDHAEPGEKPPIGSRAPPPATTAPPPDHSDRWVSTDD